MTGYRYETWYQTPGIGKPGIGNLVSETWYRKHGIRDLVSESWYRKPGIGNLVSET